MQNRKKNYFLCFIILSHATEQRTEVDTPPAKNLSPRFFPDIYIAPLQAPLHLCGMYFITD